jgi:hypothetical protein
MSQNQRSAVFTSQRARIRINSGVRETTSIPSSQQAPSVAMRIISASEFNGKVWRNN